MYGCMYSYSKCSWNFTSKDTNKQTYEYIFSPCGAKIECGNTKKPVVVS